MKNTDTNTNTTIHFPTEDELHNKGRGVRLYLIPAAESRDEVPEVFAHDGGGTPEGAYYGRWCSLGKIPIDAAGWSVLEEIEAEVESLLALSESYRGRDDRGRGLWGGGPRIDFNWANVHPAIEVEIQEALDACLDAARRQGYNGPDHEWEPTAEDLEWVCDQIGHKPTREEWADAGWPAVGDVHCSGEDTSEDAERCECTDCGGCAELATTTDDGGHRVCAECAHYAIDDDGDTYCSRCDEYEDAGEWAGGGMSGAGRGWVSRPRVRVCDAETEEN